MRRAAALTIAGLALLGCDAGREYVTANEALLAELPVYPDARLTSQESLPYMLDEGGRYDRADGYGTRAVYRVPPGTGDDDVATFFLAVEDGWTTRLDATAPPGAMYVSCAVMARSPGWKCRQRCWGSTRSTSITSTRGWEGGVPPARSSEVPGGR